MSNEFDCSHQLIWSDHGQREEGDSTHPDSSATGEPGLQEVAGQWPLIPTRCDPSGISDWQRPCEQLEAIWTYGSAASQGLLAGQGYTHWSQSGFNPPLPTIGGDVRAPSVTQQASQAFEGHLHQHTGNHQPWPPLALTPKSGNSENSDNPLADAIQLQASMARTRKVAAAKTRRYVARRLERVKAVTGTNLMSNQEYSTRPELRQEFNSQTWDNALVTAKRYSKSKPWQKIEEVPLFHRVNDNILSSKTSFVALALHYEPAWTRFHKEHYVVSRTGDMKTRPGQGLLLKLTKHAIRWYTEGIEAAIQTEERRAELLRYEGKSIQDILSLTPLPQFAETFTEAGFERYLETHALSPQWEMIGDLRIALSAKCRLRSTTTENTMVSGLNTADPV